MTRPVTPAAAMFKGASGNTLAGDVYGEEGPPVLLLHGGGQTRHAWKKTGDLIARMGRVAYAVDQRGHGDSEWVADGAYQYTDFAADARVLADTLAERSGVRPAVVGASLGGMAALLANSQPARSQEQGAAFFGAGAGRHHAAGRYRGRVENPGLHARAASRGLRLDCRGRRCGRGLSAAPAAAALPRGAEEEPAAASRRPLALALGPALPRRQPPDRRGLRRGRARAGRARPSASPSRRCWCAARPRSWCRRSTPRISSSSCPTPAMSTSAAPATWSPATATTSSQTPLRLSCRT